MFAVLVKAAMLLQGRFGRFVADQESDSQGLFSRCHRSSSKPSRTGMQPVKQVLSGAEGRRDRWTLREDSRHDDAAAKTCCYSEVPPWSAAQCRGITSGEHREDNSGSEKA